MGTDDEDQTGQPKSLTDLPSLATLPALIVPGIGNSGPQHWQTIWQTEHPHWRRIRQRDWDHPLCDEWVRELHAAISGRPEPPLLIAHSIGCLVVARWAQGSSVPARGAFLVAVPDPDGPDFPRAARGFRTWPREPLPFPSCVVASDDDPFASLAHARCCATAWGSDYVDIGPAGHINADSGHGEWREGYLLLARWLRAQRLMPDADG